MNEQWHDISTDLTEMYVLPGPTGRGVVSRPRNQISDFSAYIERDSRQQWAKQRFGDVEGAKDWCVRVLEEIA